MNLRRFPFIIFLLSSFFFLLLFFSTSPKTAFACDPPGSSCGSCTTQTCSDGSACATGNSYCVWDPNGNYCGGCTEEVNNCASQCSAPPPTGCADPANAGQKCDTKWSNNYCCGGLVCNTETWYFCLGGSCQADITFDSTQYHDPCALGASCNPGCAPAKTCNYNRTYNQCCSTGYSQSVQEYTYSDGSGVCNYVVGACNQADPGCGGATPPPGATCNYNRTYNQCCATGLSQSVQEYTYSDGSGVCNYVTGSCNQSDPACGSSPPPPGPEPTPPPGSCYSSPSNPFQDAYTTGSCTVTIKHLGWDNSDGAIGGYANSSNGSTYRTVNMNDSDLSCKPNINLQFTNNWGASSGRNFSLTDTINSKDAGNTLGAGWQLNSSSCTIGDCSTTQVGPSQRTTNSGSNTYAATLYSCGDGQCACGETSATCPGDCPPPIPAAPTTLNASCPAPGTTASLSWNSVAGATYYDVSYDASFKYNIIGTSTTIAGFNPGSGHTWGVRACNSSGCSGWSSTGSFTCVPAAPPPPIITDTQTGATITNSTSPTCINATTYSGSEVTISWTNPAVPVSWVDISSDNFATWYHKWVSAGTISTTAPSGFTNYPTDTTSFVPTTGTTYSVRLWNGSMSPSSTFNVPACPAPPAPTNLSAACPGLGTSTTFNWTASLNATSYDLRIDANPTSWRNDNNNWEPCNNLNAGDSCASPTQPSYPNSPSTANTTYGWRVRAVSPIGSSPWAVGSNFTCIAPWIQTTGDVHSNEEINAPGGP